MAGRFPAWTAGTDGQFLEKATRDYRDYREYHEYREYGKKYGTATARVSMGRLA